MQACLVLFLKTIFAFSKRFILYFWFWQSFCGNLNFPTVYYKDFWEFVDHEFAEKGIKQYVVGRKVIVWLTSKGHQDLIRRLSVFLDYSCLTVISCCQVRPLLCARWSDLLQHLSRGVTKYRTLTSDAQYSISSNSLNRSTTNLNDAVHLQVKTKRRIWLTSSQRTKLSL